MKAITRTAYGGPEFLSLQDIPTPVVKPNQVLVNVKVTTINRTDCGVLWGKPLLIRCFTGLSKPKHQVPGSDYAGIVTAIGSQVNKFSVGDRVWGFLDNGLQSHAEYLVMDQNKHIVKVPEHTSLEDAVCAGEGAHYAINFINKIILHPDDKVFVYGVTGAIGSAALQILKAKNIFVTAVANTQTMERIKELNPDRLYDYLIDDWTTDDLKYNFVFDAVGKSSFGVCRPLLEEGGAYISSELGPRNENLYLPLLTKFTNKKVIFPIPGDSKPSLELMNDLLARQLYKPLIDRTYHMEEIADAYHYVNSGQKTGNVLLKIS